MSILIFANCNDNQNVYKQGKELYTGLCANCHQENGEGVRAMIPPITKSDYLLAHRSELSCLIKKGMKGAVIVNGVTYGSQVMVGDPTLTEFEITNILNYISTSFGNSEKLWTVDEVRNDIKSCE